MLRRGAKLEPYHATDFVLCDNGFVVLGCQFTKIQKDQAGPKPLREAFVKHTCREIEYAIESSSLFPHSRPLKGSAESCLLSCIPEGHCPITRQSLSRNTPPSEVSIFPLAKKTQTACSMPRFSTFTSISCGTCPLRGWESNSSRLCQGTASSADILRPPSCAGAAKWHSWCSAGT